MTGSREHCGRRTGREAWLAVLFGWALLLAAVPRADAVTSSELVAPEGVAADVRIDFGPLQELDVVPSPAALPVLAAAPVRTPAARLPAIPAATPARYIRWGTTLPPPLLP